VCTFGKNFYTVMVQGCRVGNLEQAGAERSRRGNVSKRVGFFFVWKRAFLGRNVLGKGAEEAARSKDIRWRGEI